LVLITVALVYNENMSCRIAVPSLDEHIRCADALLEAVLKAWAQNASTRHAAELTGEFRALADKAFEYQIARRVADSQRTARAILEEAGLKQNTAYSRIDALVQQAIAREQSTRESFAKECKDYSEKEGCAILDSRDWQSYLADGPVASGTFMEGVEDLQERKP
jgi:hypothetical protein